MDKVGTVLDIAQLGTDLATITLDLMSDVERKIVIVLINLQGAEWTDGTVYMQEGTFLEPLPYHIESESGVQLAAEKKAGASATGVSGVFCYELGHKSFCIMFNVPYNGDNVWNVKIYNGRQVASETVYDELHQEPIQSGTHIKQKVLGEISKNKDIFIEDCAMMEAGQSILQVNLGTEE